MVRSLLWESFIAVITEPMLWVLVAAGVWVFRFDIVEWVLNHLPRKKRKVDPITRFFRRKYGL